MRRDRFGLLRLLLLWRNGWVARTEPANSLKGLAQTRWPKRSAILASRGEPHCRGISALERPAALRSFRHHRSVPDPAAAYRRPRRHVSFDRQRSPSWGSAIVLFRPVLG
jgi:hypothetical protein